MTDLPNGWVTAKIGDLLHGITAGKNLKCEERPPLPHERGVIKVSAVTWGTFDASQSKTLPKSYEPTPGTDIKTGDFLFSRANTLELVGAVVMARNDHPNLFLSDKILRLDFPEELKPWLLLYLGGHEGRRKLSAVSSGNQMSMRNIGQNPLKSVSVPFAPLPEQHRIVAKIEALFSELDKAVESLTLARAQLKTYRQALLKHAFEGKLTADWRAANTDKLETPEALLSRIRKERDDWYRSEQEAWETRCAEWDAGGRIGPRPARPDPHSAAALLRGEELAPLPSIPEGWSYVRLSEVACLGSGVSVSKDRQYEDPVEVAYLRVANVQRGHLDLSVIKTMPVERSQLASLALRTLDVLFNEGGDRDKLGRGWVWEDAVSPCVTQNHVFRATMYAATPAKAKLLSHWGNSEGQDYFEKGGKQTTNLASINKTVLKALPVPVMHPAEAEALFARLDSSLSQVDAVESEIDTALAKANALRQSILKQAFSGQLVAQDPADEPASALLARLRTQSRATPAARKRRA